MSVIHLLILVSLGLASAFLVTFFWAVRSGQFEDTSTPSLRLLGDDGSVSRDSTAKGARTASDPESSPFHDEH